VSFLQEQALLSILIFGESNVAMDNVCLLFSIFVVTLTSEKLNVRNLTKLTKVSSDHLLSKFLGQFIDVNLMIWKTLLQ